MNRLLLILLVVSCHGSVMHYTQFTSKVITQTTQEDDIISRSEGILTVKKNVGLKWQTGNEIYFVNQDGIWRYNKNINQVIYYEHIPPQIKALELLYKNNDKISSIYQITSQDACTHLKSYAGDEKIIICYRYKRPYQLTWESEGIKFMVLFEKFNDSKTVEANDILPVFDKKIELIKYGDIQ